MIRVKQWLCAFLVAVLVPLPAQASPTSELPLDVDDDDWLTLYQRVDRKLQQGLDAALKERRQWRNLIRNGHMAVGLVDLADPARPRFARVNGDRMMYAASLPKIAILLAAFDKMELGELALTEEIDADLAAMIRVSSNGAATRMIDRIGGLAAVNAVLADPRYGLYDDARNGGLWVGKRYAKQGPREPDPLNGISHGATVTQACRFYYLLATGRLISPQVSKTMLGYLADPGIEHKFVKSLHRVAPDAKIYRKSGTWQQWHADSVLVWGPSWRRYILVGMVESVHGERILGELVGVVEELLRAKL